MENIVPSLENRETKDREKIGDLSLVRQLFYRVISDNSDDSKPEAVYENRDWIEGIGLFYKNQLDRFIERSAKEGYGLTQTLIKDLASQGNIKEAKLVIENSKVKDNDRLISSYNYGLTLFNIEQGNFDEALKSATKVDNMFTCLELWSQTVDKATSSERQILWGQIKVMLFSVAEKKGYLYIHDIDSMISTLVKKAFENGDIKIAEVLLKEVGELTNYVAETYDDMDTGRSYPRQEACVKVGEGWAKLGEFDKAKEWMRKGGIGDNTKVEKQITEAIVDWGANKAEVVLDRLKILENNLDDVGLPSHYLYLMREWMEERSVTEAKILWDYITDNPRFMEVFKKEEKMGTIYGLWKISLALGRSEVDVFQDRLLEVAKFKKDNLVLTQFYIDLSKSEQDLKQRSQYLDKAWNEFSKNDFAVKYKIELIESILSGWEVLHEYQQIEVALALIVELSDKQNSCNDLHVNLLLLKHYSLLFKEKYGDLISPKLERLNIDDENLEQKLILLESEKDLNDLIKNFDGDQKILVKLKLAKLKEEFLIENKPFASVSIGWVHKVLTKYIGKEGQISRLITKNGVDHIAKYGGRINKERLAKLLDSKNRWWKGDKNLRFDMMYIVTNLDETNYIVRSDDEVFIRVGKKIIEDSWAEGDGEMLSLAAKMLTQTFNNNAREFLVNWLSDHVDDFETSDSEKLKGRIELIEVGLEHNIHKLNYLAYQFIGEGIFDEVQMFSVLEKLSNNRFIDSETYNWINKYAAGAIAEMKRSQVVFEITKLIEIGILLRKEFLEKFFSDLDIPFEDRLTRVKAEGADKSKFFEKVFHRDLVKVREFGETRCLIGSVYGEPVLLLQNFQAEQNPVDGHHDIITSWEENVKNVNEEDIQIHEFIIKIASNASFPVEHFLRGWIKFEDGKYVFRTDDGFTQSSESARAELISKVELTAKKYGLDHIETIPDDEYGELQRVGFMRGVVKNYTAVIENNLNRNEARKFSLLARKFFIDQAFDINSRQYEVLRSYLDLIDYYRMISRKK